jgi:SAM-dependent methyltransferase
MQIKVKSMNSFEKKSFNKDYSNLYDLFYKKKDYSKEVLLIKKLIKKKNLSILELGCGTGNYTRNLVPLAKKIVAVDKSKYMIEIAKKKNIKKTIFLTSEIKTLKFNQKFDLIISLFHILSYQKSNLEIKKFFGLSQYLKKGGFFIFDFWNEEAVNFLKPRKTTLLIKKNDYEIKRTSYPTWNKKKKSVLVKYKINIHHEKRKKNIYEEHLMKYFSLDEIKYISKKNNLEIIKNLGQNFSSFPNKKDWSVITICRKN